MLARSGRQTPCLRTLSSSISSCCVLVEAHPGNFTWKLKQNHLHLKSGKSSEPNVPFWGSSPSFATRNCCSHPSSEPFFVSIPRYIHERTSCRKGFCHEVGCVLAEAHIAEILSTCPTLVEAPPQKAVCILDISICLMYISICVLDKADIHVGIIGF